MHLIVKKEKKKATAVPKAETFYYLCDDILSLHRDMKANEQTIQQLERFFRKTAQKFPENLEDIPMTDIHVRASQESGDLMSFDDEDNEITRCVVEQWIDNKDENFYREITNVLRLQLTKMKDVVEHMGLLKPYSFVLEDDEKENVAELYVVDDDTVIIGGDLMEGLDQDLDAFMDKLLADDDSEA